MSSAEYSCKLFKPTSAYRQTVWTLIRLLLKEQSDLRLLLEEQSDLGPHCLQKWLLKSQAIDKADDNCCDWQFKGKCRMGIMPLHAITGSNFQNSANCEVNLLQFKIMNLRNMIFCNEGNCSISACSYLINSVFGLVLGPNVVSRRRAALMWKYFQALIKKYLKSWNFHFLSNVCPCLNISFIQRISYFK